MKFADWVKDTVVGSNVTIARFVKDSVNLLLKQKGMEGTMIGLDNNMTKLLASEADNDDMNELFRLEKNMNEQEMRAKRAGVNDKQRMLMQQLFGPGSFL